MALFRAWSCAFRATAAGPAAQSVPMPEMDMGPGHGPVYGHGMLRSPNRVPSQQSPCVPVSGATGRARCGTGRQAVRHANAMQAAHLYRMLPSAGLAIRPRRGGAQGIQPGAVHKHASGALKCMAGLEISRSSGTRRT